MAKSEPDDKPRGSIVVDPEMQAMNRCNKLLLALDDKTRQRVVKWLSDKHAAPETSS